jgi:hypothetical protein
MFVVQEHNPVESRLAERFLNQGCVTHEWENTIHKKYPEKKSG